MRAFCAAALAASLVSPAFAAPAPKPVIDNDEISAFDVTLAKGQSGTATPRDHDAVILFVEGGRIRTRGADGKVRVAVRHFGDAVFVPKGSDQIDTVIGGGPVHEVVAVIKDKPTPPLANPTKYPLAFPRPTAVKRLEGKRFVVWRNLWKPGERSRVHFHDKDVLVVYRYAGVLDSVALDGQVTPSPLKAGEVRFNKAGRIHSEVFVGPRESAMMLELK